MGVFIAGASLFGISIKVPEFVGDSQITVWGVGCGNPAAVPEEHRLC